MKKFEVIHETEQRTLAHARSNKIKISFFRKYYYTRVSGQPRFQDMKINEGRKCDVEVV